MGLALFTVMIVVPILEITVFILVGRYIGLWPTLACILLTALVGTVIIRFQGIGLIAAARKSIAAGEAPVGEVLQGLALFVAGALLITPGFITDTLGFLLLIPALRRRLAAGFVAHHARVHHRHPGLPVADPGAAAAAGRRLRCPGDAAGGAARASRASGTRTRRQGQARRRHRGRMAGGRTGTGRAARAWTRLGTGRGRPGRRRCSRPAAGKPRRRLALCPVRIRVSQPQRMTFRG